MRKKKKKKKKNKKKKKKKWHDRGYEEGGCRRETH